MARKALIKDNGVVENVIELDESINNFNGMKAVTSSVVKPGDLYNPQDHSFTTPPITLDARKEQRQAEVEREYNASLERGFNFNGDTFSTTYEARLRTIELVTGQNAGKGLPRGKTSKTFRDKKGFAHNFDKNQIIDLAAAGSDHIEAADDRYAELMAQIQAATTQAELDAIDVTAGWTT